MHKRIEYAQFRNLKKKKKKKKKSPLMIFADFENIV